MTTTHILTRMLNDFPTLLPSPTFFTPPSTSTGPPPLCSPLHHYHGYLPVLNTQYRIDIQLRFPPSFPPPKSSRPTLFLSVDGPLQALLSSSAPMVHQRWLQSADLHAFLLDLKDVITHIVSTSSSPFSASLPSSFYTAVVEQLREVGWSHVTRVDDDLRSVQLQAVDANERMHHLTLALPPDFPHSAPVHTVDLPIPFSFQWAASPSFRALHSHFTSVLTGLSPYFSALSALDDACVIIDPQPPSLSLPYRRIPISPSLSVLITLNPATPHPPALSFLGPPHLTQPLHFLWNRSPSPYASTTGILLQRVELVLGVELQRKAIEGEGESEGGGLGGSGCAICYEVRGEDGQVLDVQCGDVRCGRQYHAKCLYAWLSKNVKSSLIFDVCIGQCINCEQPISVPVQR